MTEKKRNHDAAALPFLRGYIPSVLALEEGGELLGEMIAKSESAAELLNYDLDHIKIATQGLLGKEVLGGMHNPTSNGVARLAKTLKLDPDLYNTFVSAFAAGIKEAYGKVASGQHKDHNIAVLEELVSKHPRLKQSWEDAKSSSSPVNGTPKKSTSKTPEMALE
ncbi:MAG: hypothetical protein AUJ12_06230 [Alphaproteobacteria bacterium CG1_02_46_17]|nr:MAG: hypothetical protein AUJ12_06230 [Alphaproteobacteria bacterium CG1_02_46_17]